MNILKSVLTLLAVAAASTMVMACGDSPANPAQPKPDTPVTPENPNPSEPTPTLITYRMPNKEIRAVWVATVGRMDWPKANTQSLQKDEMIKYLDKFQQYNINAVVMQIRPCADAFYASAFEPWSDVLTGKQGRDPGYDVLQWLIDEVHKRGMEFHAWMNPYRVANNATSFQQSADPSHPAKVHPDWTMKYGNLLIYRPARPEVKDLLLNIVDEVITKYDVDGIHFDDYFYPYPSKGVEIDDAEDFATYGKGFSNVGDFRRAQVNEVIERIHNLIVSKKPGVVFSISPFGIWRNKSSDAVNGSDSSGLQNYDDLYADVRLWCQEGWIDLVVPQLYNSTTNIAMNYTKMCQWWKQNHFKAALAIGHALYRFGVPAEGAPYQDLNQLTEQFSIARGGTPVSGSFLFNATVFNENKINILSRLAQVYGDRALIPFMGRATADAPAAVTDLRADGRTLSWQAVPGAAYYAVYRVTPTSTDVKVYNAKVAGTSSTAAFTVPAAGSYAVSALSADNQESALTQPLRVD